MLTHAQGDRACRDRRPVCRRAVGPTVRTAGAPSTEARQVPGPDDPHRAAAIGASPSFHVDHVRYYGPELAGELIVATNAPPAWMPIRSAVDAGHRVSLHADSPMYPPGLLRLAGTAVTRRTRPWTTIAADQAITAVQELRAVTIDAAWQLGLDDEVGSIEVGNEPTSRWSTAHYPRRPDRHRPIRIESTWLRRRAPI
ncbi:MAG: amidohydrolase family protein [Ilumatobacteraceae bacterium]